MARHDVNQTKTQRMITKTSKVLNFNRPPLVIPRDKLEAAHLKVRKAQDKVKYLIGSNIVLAALLVWALLK